MANGRSVTWEGPPRHPPTGPMRHNGASNRPCADCRPTIYHRASVITELETATSFGTGRAERDTRRAAAEGRAPVIVLGAIVVGAFLLYTLLTTGVDGPACPP